ncbi:MAG TPA: ComEA family DNA-binding protein [Longimicrobiales bacterium]|nr:ComEA family DNA-binding protein [Longimicrobiales bacterium]
MNLQHFGMTGEERKALSFVAILLGLSVVARAVHRPEPLVVAGASAVDIGSRLQENQQVRARSEVSKKTEIRSRPDPPEPATPPPVLDLNRATVTELDALPGIGPAVAQRIVDYREARGRFTAIEQLDSVKGIGPALLARIRPRVKF